ncbi:hypothetical protein [Cylindrospermum sp. FACHB-282]|uniref:hypothetical protein n=1 Tax=Cylindrospermum sp. FACHB-282 TaxID=2692794 RepID=UPI00168234B8|nr:hypothetical protein [Cylindrospermum sp. FACHB-282]
MKISLITPPPIKGKVLSSDVSILLKRFPSLSGSGVDGKKTKTNVRILQVKKETVPPGSVINPSIMDIGNQKLRTTFPIHISALIICCILKS